ncbi:hypothetical protein VULLAG_LOCUS10601 [Vulpes lagopus]
MEFGGHSKTSFSLPHGVWDPIWEDSTLGVNITWSRLHSYIWRLEPRLSLSVQPELPHRTSASRPLALNLCFYGMSPIITPRSHVFAASSNLKGKLCPGTVAKKCALCQ